MRGLILSVTCFMSLAAFGSAAQAASRYAATLAGVVDAVTYVVDVHMDGQVQRIRLVLDGVEGPKLYGRQCEREAALFAKELARSILHPSERLIISDLHRENAQFVGRIEFDGRSLENVLMGFNQVRPRGNVVNWCSTNIG